MLTYLRFCARLPAALFFGAGLAARAGLRAGARRSAGRAVFFAAVFCLAGAAVRARVWPLAAARAAVGAGRATAAGLAFTSG